ncbi:MULTISPECIES: methyltransferase domain-containing protein [unclassified Micromonospora]|uniref:methyltransferase domain-containing protein n=1 Tax=unclassified Micromonospora TaxID=2617518 RepID=UPI001B361C32|nr:MULTISPECIES: methyltransferase domain-containing protein [unclassified Micromonospora]MBQ1041045.1 methyltransferase domain-containing protein [Micromonospora sp. C72]MBQ1055154.1 methyltransferase domain-containing protein [Micromonospora sp. C32]
MGGAVNPGAPHAFDGLAAQYVALTSTPWQRLRHRLITANLDRHLTAAHRSWLDVGAGDGLLAVELATRGRRVTLVEPAADLRDVARQRLTSAGLLDSCEVVAGSVDDVPRLLTGRPTQGLSLHNVLEYLPDAERALDECLRPLPSGCLVSVVVGNPYGQLLADAARGADPVDLLDRLRAGTLTVGLDGRRFTRPPLPVEDVAGWMRAAGSHVVGRYGVRVLNDLMAAAPGGRTPDPEAVFALDRAAGDDPVLSQVARYVHLVGEKR